MAAKIMHADSLAIVTGKTIHLWNAGREDFLRNKKWLRHELVHIDQYRKYGWLRFIFLYLKESYAKGYYNNRFEAEARAAENTAYNIKDFDIC